MMIYIDYIGDCGDRCTAILQPIMVLNHLIMHDTRNIRDACTRIIRDHMHMKCMGIIDIKLLSDEAIQ